MTTKTKDKKPADKKPTPDRVEKFSTSARCALTPKELETRSDRVANLVGDIAQKEDDKKAAAKHAQSEIDLLTAELMTLSNEVRTRATYRMVEHERRFIYAEAVVRESRLDTGDLLSTRKMTEREMQLDLFPEGGDGKPTETTYPDDLWRPMPIADALKGLPKKCYDAFEKASIDTMGAFADFQSKKGEFWVADLVGVGPGMAEKISDAAILFWSTGILEIQLARAAQKEIDAAGLNQAAPDETDDDDSPE
jgi:hypothetical protein